MPGILWCKRVANIIEPFIILFPQGKGRRLAIQVGGGETGSNFGQLTFAWGKCLQLDQNSKTEYNNPLKKHIPLDFVLFVDWQTFFSKKQFVNFVQIYPNKFHLRPSQLEVTASNPSLPQPTSVQRGQISSAENLEKCKNQSIYHSPIYKKASNTNINNNAGHPFLQDIQPQSAKNYKIQRRNHWRMTNNFTNILKIGQMIITVLSRNMWKVKPSAYSRATMSWNLQRLISTSYGQARSHVCNRQNTKSKIHVRSLFHWL